MIEVSALLVLMSLSSSAINFNQNSSQNQILFGDKLQLESLHENVAQVSSGDCKVRAKAKVVQTVWGYYGPAFRTLLDIESHDCLSNHCQGVVGYQIPYVVTNGLFSGTRNMINGFTTFIIQNGSIKTSEISLSGDINGMKTYIQKVRISQGDFVIEDPIIMGTECYKR